MFTRFENNSKRESQSKLSIQTRAPRKLTPSAAHTPRVFNSNIFLARVIRSRPPRACPSPLGVVHPKPTRPLCPEPGDIDDAAARGARLPERVLVDVVLCLFGGRVLIRKIRIAELANRNSCKSRRRD